MATSNLAHRYFTWDKAYFPNPIAMQSDLASRGRKVRGGGQSGVGGPSLWVSARHWHASGYLNLHNSPTITSPPTITSQPIITSPPIITPPPIIIPPPIITPPPTMTLLPLFQMVTIVDPHIKSDPNYRVFKEAEEKQLFVKTKDGADFKGWVWP